MYKNLFKALVEILEQDVNSVSPIKSCVRYIFASLFCMSKWEHFWNKEKCFLFHLKFFSFLG